MKDIKHNAISIEGSFNISKEQMEEKQAGLFDILIKTIQEQDGDKMSYLVEAVEKAMGLDPVLRRVLIMKLIHGELPILKEMGVIEAAPVTVQ